MKLQSIGSAVNRPSVRRQKTTAVSTLIFALLCSGPVIAQNPYFQKLGPYNSTAAGFGQIATFQNAALFTGKDDRESYHEWAKSHGMSEKSEEFHKLFGASGKILCSHYYGSAELACDSQTLITVAHMFVDKKTGRHIADPGDCTFVIEEPDPRGNLRKVRIPLTNEYVAGLNIHENQGDAQKDIQDIEHDWAVVKLSRTVKGVTPYEVWQENPAVQSNVVGLKITTVSAREDDIKSPTISSGCEIKQDYKGPLFGNMPRALLSNCNWTHGASGGAELNFIRGHSVLVSVNVGGSVDSQHPNKRIPYNFQDPHKSVHVSASNLIEKGFQDAISRICSKPLKNDRVQPSSSR